MITIKTAEQIETVKKGGVILKKALDYTCKHAVPGITTLELDALAEKFITDNGGEPGFKRVPGYRWTSCICINDQIVHTPPSRRVIRESDVVTIDMGVFYGGLHTDSATTFVVGTPTNQETVHFLRSGKRALDRAISKAKAGNRIGHISQEIYTCITGDGYYIIKELTGHGVGAELHEDPLIPGYVDRPIDTTPRIKPGMILAIEVIYSIKKDHMTEEKGNDWSIITKHGSLSACFESTIAILENQTMILT